MKVLLIPSAVLMPQEMRKSFGDLPTCLFPLGGADMLTMLCRKYKNAVDQIYVVAYERHEWIERHIKMKKLPVQMICLDRLDNLGYTIEYGLDVILQEVPEVEYVYINFADSFLEDTLPSTSNDFVYYAEQNMDASWTWFREDSGHIIDVFDKGDFKEEKIPDKSFKKLFVGVFGISDVQDFTEQLHQAARNTTVDSFYGALWAYSQKHHFDFLESFSWFDVGHNENYIKAKTKVAARAFNSIKIDEERGILTKTSENKEKLINEIRWYLRMPSSLQYLIPRIYDYSLDFLSPYVSMEYYGYHTLHESLVYGKLSLGEWKNIFKKLLFLIQDMQTFRISGRKQEIEAAVYEMYLDKTRQRLDKLRNKKEFADFFDHKIFINGVEYNSLDKILAILPYYVKKILVDNAYLNFTIIHGDLCFTNILVEDNYNFMRIIDPRGKFGTFDIYGDSRYELAKILHSLEGHYDYIIEDMFDVEVQDTHISYHLQLGEQTALQAFQQVFEKQLTDIQAIRLIEATLFLSMIPLHNDYLSRQYAMLATGITLFDEVVKEGVL
jgi:hypothetical protein